MRTAIGKGSDVRLQRSGAALLLVWWDAFRLETTSLETG